MKRKNDVKKKKSGAKQLPPKPGMKPLYTVLCHRNDCGDEDMFVLEGMQNGRSRTAARHMMREDFRLVYEDWCYDCEGGDGTPCEITKKPDEIVMDVPTWNADTGREDWIRFHWKVVGF